MATISHQSEDMMASCLPPGITGWLLGSLLGTGNGPRTTPSHTLAVFVNNRFSAGLWQSVAIDSMYRLYYGHELLGVIDLLSLSPEIPRVKLDTGSRIRISSKVDYDDR